MKDIIDTTFKLTPKGIHLLRNKYTYHMIAYKDVESAYLSKGKSVKNWIVIIVFGGIFLTLSVFLLYHLLNSLLVSDKTVRFYNVFGHGLIAVMILGVAGIVSIYSSLKTVPIIQILTNKSSYKLRVYRNKKKVNEVLSVLSSYGVDVERGNFQH
ncbi:hypothetical protein ACFOUP_16290 [Belliella kenyensis]|uniref:Uncharacterized protein n=1 Tax=Belliella kenyensis TaxID=1472724 RepID=A0ABV8ERH1_9BACT|nr:hypothetical protein [Belliella kenyensis]MCH7401826.1 hypothetical protein [Belliella kenyensis]MDN3604326.1 hypothetical protein [Belliella kenyensis]